MRKILIGLGLQLSGYWFVFEYVWLLLYYIVSMTLKSESKLQRGFFTYNNENTMSKGQRKGSADKGACGQAGGAPRGAVGMSHI